ncbi:LuxR family transcriptional regulator [Mycobacterium sp. 360MFTsu5.1]|uniref:ATP-binding protein n=1 Tax=Mycobacterium sp. 360MFTsu5.1 TaxID=1172186 RepID=UPI001E2D241F|nr:LuxR family transcriptional regulator [Mycobacterium sp. 360MFTsu5.1]
MAAPNTRAPLVERDRPLAELGEHAAAALSGAGRLVVIRGEAGIGKSSVVRAFCDTVGGARVVVGHCASASAPVPLGPVLGLCERLDDDVSRRLTAAINGQAGAGGVPYAVASVLAAVAPLIWVIEDAQWADSATLDVLRYVTRRLARIPVLLVVTYRDDEVGSRHPLAVALGDVVGSNTLARIDLSLLSLSGVRALVGTRPDVDVAELRRVTGGNPFLVTEALVAGWAGDTPTAVRYSMEERLARLSPAGRDAAAVVAVLGPDATPDLVEWVAPDSGAGVAECVAAGVLNLIGERLEFRHELARRAVWTAIPPDRRRTLHAAVVGALAHESPDREMLPQLAFHAEEAGDTTAVLRFAPRAADDAATLGAHRQAVDQYARALRHADGVSPEIRAQWWEGRSRAAYLCGLREDAVQSISEAVALRREVSDALREGDDLRLLSHRSYPLRPLDVVRELAERAVGLLEPLGATPELAWAYANRTQLACLTYDHAAAVGFASKAVRLGATERTRVAALWAEAFESISRVTRGSGEWSLVDAVWRQARCDPEAIEAAGLAAVMASFVAMQHHDRATAARYLLDPTDFFGEHNLPGFRLIRQGTLALMALDAGRYSEAETLAVDVLDRAELTPLHYLQAQVAAATVRARTGRGEVWPLLDAALNSHDPADTMRAGIVWAARIEAAWLAGDIATATVEVEGALSKLTADVDGWLIGRIGGWAQIVGIECPELPARPAGPYARQLAGDWLGAAADWDRMGCPYQASIARLHSGACGAAEAGLAELESLGARAAVVRAGPLLRAHAHRAGTGPETFGLSFRQRQVAELLVAQCTDREIADALLITPKTASHHVSAILAKLSVPTRAAARRRLLDVDERVVQLNVH